MTIESSFERVNIETLRDNLLTKIISDRSVTWNEAVFQVVYSVIVLPEQWAFVFVFLALQLGAQDEKALEEEVEYLFQTAIDATSNLASKHWKNHGERLNLPYYPYLE